MLLLYSFGRLHQVHFALLALLLLRVVYFGASQLFGIDLSWTLSRLLILQYIPWFALGLRCFLSCMHAINRVPLGLQSPPYVQCSPCL
jgi:hypothetical protein